MLALSSSENLQTAKQIKISASREKTQIYLIIFSSLSSAKITYLRSRSCVSCSFPRRSLISVIAQQTLKWVQAERRTNKQDCSYLLCFHENR